MGDPAELMRTERYAFVDLLVTLTDDEWATPSLCAEWTVQDVAAHLAWAPVQPPAQMFGPLVRDGLRLNRTMARTATGWARRGREAIIDQLRKNAASNAKPFGVPPVTALADAVLHGIDVRRPLGKKRAIPQEAFTATADFLTGARWPLTITIGGSPRARVSGVRLVADDLDWSHGQGPDVHGSADTVMLVLSGRSVRPDELRGPGAAALLRRL